MRSDGRQSPGCSWPSAGSQETPARRRAPPERRGEPRCRTPPTCEEGLLKATRCGAPPNRRYLRSIGYQAGVACGPERPGASPAQGRTAGSSSGIVTAAGTPDLPPDSIRISPPRSPRSHSARTGQLARVCRRGGTRAPLGPGDGRAGPRPVVDRRHRDRERGGVQPRRVRPRGGDGRRIVLWGVATREKLAKLPQGKLVLSVAFAPDGKLLAAGDSGGAVAIWDPTARQRLRTFGAHSWGLRNLVRCLCGVQRGWLDPRLGRIRWGSGEPLDRRDGRSHRRPAARSSRRRRRGRLQS